MLHYRCFQLFIDIFISEKMAPPKYDDLGKEAKDLINKNFHFGVIKLEGKTKAKNGVVSLIELNNDQFLYCFFLSTVLFCGFSVAIFYRT